MKHTRIFVVGGTGAQGLPVIGALVADKKYSVRALSRDPASRRASALLALGNVSILKGTFAAAGPGGEPVGKGATGEPVQGAAAFEVE